MALVKYNDNSISAISSAGQLAQGSLVPIKTLTASGSASLSFVDGSNDVVLDSTYPIYKFEFINIHPATNNAEFSVNCTVSGTNYDATKTTTVFEANHTEDDSGHEFSYQSGDDIAQGTGFQTIAKNIGNDNDSSCSGELMLFNPSSTTFVKHFIGRSNKMEVSVTGDFLVAGYCNVTSAIDGVQFKMSSGNIDSGTIKLYGIKDS